LIVGDASASRLTNFHDIGDVRFTYFSKNAHQWFLLRCKLDNRVDLMTLVIKMFERQPIYVTITAECGGIDYLPAE
jgi:hypothetical protein